MELVLNNQMTFLLLTILIFISSFGFYKYGWHKRNLQKNSYLQKQSEYLNQIYIEEKDLRRKTISRSYRTIRSLLDEIKRLNHLISEKDNIIDSLKEANSQKNKALENITAFPKSIQFKTIRALIEKES